MSSAPVTDQLDFSQDASEDAPRLPLPDEVVPGDINWPYAITIGVFHLAALLVVLPWFFTWTGVITMAVGVFVFGQGINLCYHRLLTHRSFVVPAWLERVFVIMALCCFEDTPGKWVAIHRYHHIHSDHQPDPHSPRVTFLWSHVGWLVVRNRGAHNVKVYRKYASDVLSKPFYMKLEKSLLWLWIYIAHAIVFFAIGMGIGAMVGGDLATAWRYGASMLIWGVILRTVVVWHITWSVNSLSHLFGYQNYETGEDSRNNWLVALLAVGEGWHNNHHHDPASATNQHRWWEFDITYGVIKCLEIVGLATKVTKPRHIRHAAREKASS
ncbi:MAG: fatty acid desaturase [Planctomycetota bacterium]